MENNKKSIIFAIVLLLVVVIAGVSFAYFSAIITGSESSSTIYMDAGELSITYSDNSNALDVSATKIYPRDEEWITKKFKVTGNNTTELAMYYNIYLVVDYSEFEFSLTYSLESENTTNNGMVVPSVSDKNLYDLSYMAKNEITEDDGEREFIDYMYGDKGMHLGTGYFTGGENQEHNYTLKIYFKDNGKDQNEYQKAKFAAHIEIGGASSVKAEPDGWKDAEEGTLLAGIKSNYSAPSVPLTNPGKDYSTNDEAVMSATQDDYGTSYYFRGNVQNNYVAFANMCWRIVRVTGDGSIKLILHNYNSNDCTETGDNLAFARYYGDTYTTVFNEDYEGRAHIGYMFGVASFSRPYNYSAEHANINKSTILTNLEAWYESKLSTYEENLADTIWCNDKSSDTQYGILYGATAREYQFTPSLICPNDNEGSKLSKFTVSDTTNGNGALDKKIGLLTYDELAYSGFYFDLYEESNEISNYLTDNVGDNNWWTISPTFLSEPAGIVTVNTVISGSKVDSLNALRPAIALKNTTTISSGTGTATSPFVIS